jgi:hypothetical protein
MYALGNVMYDKAYFAKHFAESAGAWIFKP